MKATELRIGNYAKYNGKVISCSIEAIREFYYIGDTHAKSIKDKREYLPITLNPGWFKLAGFHSKSVGHYNIDDFQILYSNTENHEYILDGYPLKIKYVHQLQNLYLLIKEVELEFLENGQYPAVWPSER